MKRGFRFFGTVLVLIAAAIGPAESAWAGAPTDALRTTIDEVLRILEDPVLKVSEKKQERRKLLEGVISRRFNFDTMAKWALGAEWEKRTAEERRDFVTSLRTLLLKTYIKRIENKPGEKTKYLKEFLDVNLAEVHTQIDAESATFPIDYKLEKESAEWRVYDVVIEGVSLLQNYREQFKRLLRKESFETLAEQLRNKAESIPGYY
jgi:phospholipid transport system substrate-binding protein